MTPQGAPVTDPSNEDERYHTHLLTLFSVAAGMVGVCVTAIGLIGIMRTVNELETIVDDLLAIGALLFMIVTTLSFLGLRADLSRTWRRFAITLDALFCIALVVLVVASTLLTWVVI
jgi:hypothetical protein